MKVDKDNIQLRNELKLSKANAVYYKDMFTRAQERIRYLEKHATELQEVLDKGYKQADSFNKDHSGIYRIYNKHTDRSYVGQSSKDVYNRCMSHFKQANYNEDDWHLDLIENPDDYEYEIIIEGVENQGDLDKLEIYYIGKYDCIDKGYNKALAAKYKFIEKYNSRTP